MKCWCIWFNSHLDNNEVFQRSLLEFSDWCTKFYFNFLPNKYRLFTLFPKPSIVITLKIYFPNSARILVSDQNERIFSLNSGEFGKFWRQNHRNFRNNRQLFSIVSKILTILQNQVTKVSGPQGKGLQVCSVIACWYGSEGHLRVNILRVKLRWRLSEKVAYI